MKIYKETPIRWFRQQHQHKSTIRVLLKRDMIRFSPHGELNAINDKNRDQQSERETLSTMRTTNFVFHKNDAPSSSRRISASRRRCREQTDSKMYSSDVVDEE